MKPVSSFSLKSKLRKTYIAKRRKLSASYRDEAAVSAAQIFIHLPSFKKSEHIACYLPVKDEFDTSRLIEAIWQAKKQCYLPVLNDGNTSSGKSLCFVRYRKGDPLHFNRYAIAEPIQIESQIKPEQLDIVLTPLIAFDRIGNRLGTGGGYYDRTFAWIERRDKPLMYGLSFARQEANLLPHDPWDIPLNGIITEKEFIKCRDVSST